MPFKNQAQRRFLFAKYPKIAHEFAEKTKMIKALPEKIGMQIDAIRKRLKKKRGKV